MSEQADPRPAPVPARPAVIRPQVPQVVRPQIPQVTRPKLPDKRG